MNEKKRIDFVLIILVLLLIPVVIGGIRCISHNSQVAAHNDKVAESNAEIAGYNSTSIFGKLLGSGKSKRDLIVESELLNTKGKRLSAATAKYDQNPWLFCIGM